MKLYRLKYCIPALLLLLVNSCSNQKNTGLTRNYHTITSRYNILFNGWESYKKGMLRLEESHQDIYSEVLPVFIYNSPSEVSSIASDMDRAIEKGKKVISMHSITTKPEIDDDKELTDAQREFYNKKEYNKWVSSAYLLMGKGHFYKHEFSEAAETFRFITGNYPDEEPQYEARIWLSRIALKNDRLKEAGTILAELDEEDELPKGLKAELLATKAALELQNKDFQQAIEHLKESLDLTKSRYYKQRYNFILAQLYDKQGNAQLASRHYHQVIKLNPPYEMTFNARINMALSYKEGAFDRKDIEKQLQKMIRDDKNIEYQDQIYYAWGNLYKQEGNIDKAMDYYLKSSTASVGNTQQQALTFLTIADIYYVQPQYLPAQAYYDSAVGVINSEYPNYEVIYAKSISLTNLVDNIHVIELQDSVQRLSYMPKDDLYLFIENVIEQEREREREEKDRQRLAQLQSTFASQQQFEIESSGDSWYFYNPTAVNLGRQQFKKKWGARPLEDNWRRTDKSVVNNSFGFGEDSFQDDELVADSSIKSSLDKNSIDYYLVDIPFTDSAMEVSNQKIMEAYVNIGDIYYHELKDFDKAVNSYETLLKRFPNYENKLSIYYKLYTIGKQIEDINLVSKYQQKIINEYPNSNYALALTDPEYFKRIEQQERREDILYEEVYEAFNKDNHVRALSLIEQAHKEIPEGKYNMQYDYIQTISAGINKDTVDFIDDLKKIISRYPNSEYATRAQLLVNYLNTSNPEAAKTQAIQQAATLYKMPNEEEEHFVLVTLPGGGDYNQLMFNVINFNIDKFSESELKVSKTDISGRIILQVSGFKKMNDAVKYFIQLKTDKDIYHDVSAVGSSIMYISKTNSNILRRDKKLDDYITFFQEKLQ